MASGFLARALDARFAELVGINEVKFLPWSHPQLHAMGVKGLSACSVVVIGSKFGGIVAHIGPNIPGSEDPVSFIRLVEQKMDDTKTMYDYYKATYFPENTKTYVICATFEGSLTSPEQRDIMVNRIQRMGLPDAIKRVYVRRYPSEITDRGANGTVLVDGRGDFPKIYVEDKDVTEGEDSITTATTTVDNGSWQLHEGGSIYYLVNGQVSRTTTLNNPPLNVWIYRRADGKYIMYNGTSWITNQ